MQLDGGITIFSSIFGGVFANDMLVFAMCHNQHVSAIKDVAQALSSVHQHVARTGTHKEFDARHTMLVQFVEQVVVAVGGTEITTIVC